MNKLFLINTLFINLAIANTVVDEAQLIAARNAGNSVYTTCIVTPPITPAQQATCSGLYSAYNNSLAVLNAPFPLVMSTSVSPYTWSPYDICKYEVTHLVFPPEGFPICPVSL